MWISKAVRGHPEGQKWSHPSKALIICNVKKTKCYNLSLGRNEKQTEVLL